MIYRQRKAFSMITAIFVILLMATVTGFVMDLSGKIVQETTHQYQKEQAMLLAKSYTELAIMTVMSNDRNATASCIDKVTGEIGASGAALNGEGYKVDTHIAFIGHNDDIRSCPLSKQLGNPNVLSEDLNIIVDVYVRYKNINQAIPANSPWITYHRRTLQKI